ncbi:hypothetical protein ACQE7P_22685 [Klebsiella pneumoniae]|uniref:hypothetical protein n=1 Tax=Klebsiella pneumoniae TaxID=573 RepID=UPI000E2BE6C0|nr:hypothetical protein [Klebsiella pneumoniae]MDX6860502.1 hypothetical protein [Klebsiella pneumoniae]SWZ66223.1 Uncharacterised protein [Klebsiella pneumoniae]SYH85080.1 Uncharacterised protein [Klebsiella pneumoniae]HBR7696029.1 hypothetical protein [Klebsiella pneumoniae]HBY6960350.1 hypothetical protein [Klebsiella pneumoniae]
MDEEIMIPPFDEWFSEIVSLAKENNLRPVYKGAWVDFFDKGMTPSEAISNNAERLQPLS